MEKGATKLVLFVGAAAVTLLAAPHLKRSHPLKTPEEAQKATPPIYTSNQMTV